MTPEELREALQAPLGVGDRIASADTIRAAIEAALDEGFPPAAILDAVAGDADGLAAARGVFAARSLAVPVGGGWSAQPDPQGPLTIDEGGALVPATPDTPPDQRWASVPLAGASVRFTEGGGTDLEVPEVVGVGGATGSAALDDFAARLSAVELGLGAGAPAPIGVPEQVRAAGVGAQGQPLLENFVGIRGGPGDPRLPGGASPKRFGARTVFGIPRSLPGGQPPTTDLDAFPELVAVPPRYFDGHELSLFRARPAAEVAEIQATLIEAGLLDPASIVRPGVWLTPEAEAMRPVLAFANTYGLDWLAGLNWYRNNPIRPQTTRFVTPEFLPTDYASLAQTVKDLARRELGRDFQPWEMTLLTDELGRQNIAAQEQAYRQALAEEEATRAEELARRSETATAVRGLDPEGLDAGLAGSSGPQPQIGDPQIDPMSRFLEFFDQRYGPEIARERDRPEVATQLETAFAGVRRMLNAVRGA